MAELALRALRHGTRQLTGERTRHGAWCPPTGRVLRRHVAGFVSAVDTSGTKSRQVQIAQEGLRQITALYRVETQIRSLPASRRLAVRQDKSAPMVADFKTWLEQARAQVSAKSPTGEALKYMAKYWDGLVLFLADGRIGTDNNTVERTIRPTAIGRKNSLFAGHEARAQNWAVLASLLETCKLNGIEPHGYLTQTLTAIVNGHRQSQISEILPRNYAQTV